jgi:hypothetical protein
MIKSALIEIRSVLGASLVAAMMALPPHAFAHDAAMHAAPTKAARVELATAAAFGPDGQLYAVSKDGGHLQLIRSHDDGNHWSAPLRVNAQPEPIAADGDSQPRIAFNADGDLLVSWTKPLPRPYTGEIRLARLPVGAAAFDAPITVHHDRAEITHRFQNILAGPDGRITAVWIDKRDQEAAKAKRSPTAARRSTRPSLPTAGAALHPRCGWPTTPASAAASPSRPTATARPSPCGATCLRPTSATTPSPA